VNDWAVVFLGVIAAATLITAIAQVGFIVATGRLARRLERAADDVQREVRPLVEHLDAIGRDARRASSLAVAQLERVDHMAADLADRLDRTLNTLQTAAAGGVREGAAMLAAFRAAMAVVREFRASRARTRAEDDDALFI
jgi:flagellar biosynthesis/type III secretory pathway M-ring protein FliF/YscJ